MSIVAIISSPRKGGYGDSIAQKVIDGVRSTGKDVKVYHLNDMKAIRQCQNCECCKNNGGKCILKDDLAPLIDDIRDAEGIIQVTSINFNDTNGLFKMYFDRLYCFLDASASTIMPKGKKVATVVTASADESAAEKVSVELEKVMVQHFFCEPVGRLTYVTWMMPIGEYTDETILDRAEELGRKF